MRAEMQSLTKKNSILAEMEPGLNISLMWSETGRRS